MSFETALRASEVLLALAFIQQSAEHIATTSKDRALFVARVLSAVLLLTGIQSLAALLALALISLVMLDRFQGPYNGGSDKMSLLILWCLLGVRLMPDPLGQEVIFAYLALQLTLSYFISGRVKIVNAEWRSGRALSDVFAFSAYPVSEGLRGLATRPRLLWAASWSVILFEVLFPLALLHQTTLIIALFVAAGFHLANACLFGLNRFFWIWLAAYPSLIWFQEQLFGG